MARVLGAKSNTIRMKDNLGGGEIELYYRMPTTVERAAYANESIVRKRGQVDFAVGETRQKFGADILIGIREGDFVSPGGNPIASDPESGNYQANWKDQVCESASDIVELLAIYVFESPSAVISPERTPEKN
jgi:hypothetical protein